MEYHYTGNSLTKNLSIQDPLFQSPVKCMAISAGTKKMQRLAYSPENIKRLA